MKSLANIAAATGLALLMGAPAFAVQSRVTTTTTTVTDYTTVQGHITAIDERGDQYRIQLDNGVSYWVPAPMVRDRNFHVGDIVTVGGYGQPNAFNVEIVNPMTVYPTTVVNGPMVGIVQNVNRHLNYFTVRDAQTGRWFKVDVRSMNTRRSVNVWRLRPGDRVTVDGGWENRDTFQADRVQLQ